MRSIAICLAVVLSACSAPAPSATDAGAGRADAAAARSAVDAAATRAATSAAAASVTTAAATAPVQSNAPAAPPHPATPTVPERFQGEWNQVPEHCGTAMNDSRLRIGADGIQYYESRGPIRAAVASGRDELALIVELSGEGETWLATEHFRLSPDGRTLTTVGEPGNPLVRMRCDTASR